MSKRICESCEQYLPHYSHKLCYRCYRELQCRWLADIDLYVDTMEKPQCQNIMYKMGLCKKHWKHIQHLEKKRKKQRPNPRFSPFSYEPEEPSTLGVKESDIYPLIVYDAQLPLADALILRGNNWLDDAISGPYSGGLPPELRNLRMENIHLTIITNERYATYKWYLTDSGSGSRLGSGIFVDSEISPKRCDPEAGYFEGTVASISLQGFGIYPSLLVFMRDKLGPLRSDKCLTEGAKKAWARAGAVFRGGRWYLD